MANKIGIKETKEMLVAVNVISIMLIQRLKDGIDLDDGFAFWEAFTSESEVKKAVVKAWDEYKKIPEELEDIDIGEIIELIKLQSDFVPEIIQAMKK